MPTCTEKRQEWDQKSMQALGLKEPIVCGQAEDSVRFLVLEYLRHFSVLRLGPIETLE
jgi:hypothetical protein